MPCVYVWLLYRCIFFRHWLRLNGDERPNSKSCMGGSTCEHTGSYVCYEPAMQNTVLPAPNKSREARVCVWLSYRSIYLDIGSVWTRVYVCLLFLPLWWRWKIYFSLTRSSNFFLICACERVWVCMKAIPHARVHVRVCECEAACVCMFVCVSVRLHVCACSCVWV